MRLALIAAATLWLQEPTPAPAALPSFECQLVPSADLGGVDRWYGAEAEQFELAGTERLVRGQTLLLYTFFQGYARDESGSCDLTFDVRIRRPDGGVYHEASAQRGLQGDPGGSEVVLAQNLTGLCFDPEDALGTYQVEIVAHDQVGHGSAHVEQAIELVEYAEGEPFADVDQLWGWQWSYYHGPDPCRAAQALRVLAPLGLAEISPMHGALVQLFESNPWLFPILFADLARADAQTRELLAWVLARSRQDAAQFLGALDAKERAAYERFAQTPNPIADPLRGRDDLNELAGRYALGRDQAALRRLVLALSPTANEVVADVALHEPKLDVDVPLPSVMSKAATTLLSRYVDDPATRGYLVVMARDESLAVDVRERIGRLLAGEKADTSKR